MLSYLVGRLAQGILTILLVMTVVFMLINLSGDPIRMMLPPSASASDVQAMRESFGFDQPLVIRYMKFIEHAVRFDFGESIQTRRSAAERAVQRLPATVILAFSSLVLAALLGVPLGILSAIHRGQWIDTVAVLLSVIGQAIPIFWIALVLILVFGVIWPILPPSGYGSLRHLALPTFSIAMFLLAGITRITRTSMLEVLAKQYLVTARAKGVSERVVIFKHALRNAAIPIVTQLVLQMRFVIGGSVVVESIFGWPGLGQLLASAAYARDYPVVVASTVFIACFIVLFNILLDAVYTVIDPKVRFWT